MTREKSNPTQSIGRTNSLLAALRRVLHRDKNFTLAKQDADLTWPPMPNCPNQALKDSYVYRVSSGYLLYQAAPRRRLFEVHANTSDVMGQGIYVYESPAMAQRAAAVADGNRHYPAIYPVIVTTSNLYQAGANYPTETGIERLKQHGFDGIRMRDGEVIVFDADKVQPAGEFRLANVNRLRAIISKEARLEQKQFDLEAG